MPAILRVFSCGSLFEEGIGLMSLRVLPMAVAGRHMPSLEGAARRLAPALIATVAFVLAFSCSSASATLTHFYLSSFGAFSNVQGVAVGSSGDVYVYDGGAGRVYKFDGSGNPVNFSSTATNSIGGVGFAAGGEGEIAVDGSSGPAKGDIYVAHADGSVNIYGESGAKLGELTQKAGVPWGEACGVAVDSSGDVYLGLYSEHVDKYVPSANPVTDSDYAASMGGMNGMCNIAVDSAGNVFSDQWGLGPVARYEPSQFGSLSATGSVIDSKGSTLAVDPANDEVYVDERGGVSQFGAHGEPFEAPIGGFASSGAGAISGSLGIAVSGVNHEVYVSNGKGQINVFGPAMVAATVTTGGATVTGTSATMNGTVNPEGVAVEECFFEYGETTAYGQSVPCVPGSVGAGSTPVEVHADLTGLGLGTYHYRLVATNKNGPATGADATFTIALPKVEEEYATDVAASSATLEAKLNPQGHDTTYLFEYGPTSGYGSSTPEMDAGTAIQLVQAHPQDLLPASIYHYRLVASNSEGTTDGPDQTLTTQSLGSTLRLLDGRQWELVSPQDKHGAGILPKPFEGGLVQAAEDGSGISYLATESIEASPEGNRAPEMAQILAKRVPAGWSNQTIDTPNEEIHGLAVGTRGEYRMFSPDLSLAAIEPHSPTPLAATATERTQYLRDQAACQARLNSCFTPLLTPEDTLPGTKWDPNPTFLFSDVRFVAASSDLKRIMLHAEVALTAGASEKGLYEWSNGQLQFVSILPENEGGTPVDANLGDRSNNVTNAISSDGSRIVWSHEGGLYMRDVERGETVRLDPGGAEPRFEIASSDTSRVFFTEKGALPEEDALYVCEMAEVAGKLVCDRSQVAAGGVIGTVGASSDGTSVYFAANGVLAAGAEPGNCGLGPFCNVYLAQLKGNVWSLRFVASPTAKTLTREGTLRKQAARVSSDGRFLVFMTYRSLTGYDNRDAVSGERDEEVFLYDAVSEKLFCVSCNPTGARPSGWFDRSSLEPPLVDSTGVWTESWLAANVPGWSNFDLEHALYQPRYLSDSGQVFFNSSDALVPQDTNGQQDVYEYEPDGVGGCARGGGCVQLVSGGGSGEESVFLDASASGGDVFFLTSARLVAQDQDTAYDLYDARVCSSSAPCVQPPAPPLLCMTGDACKAAPTPQPAVFGEPASATYTGMGNLAPAIKKVAPKQVRLTRAQRLARALRACGRRVQRKRAACRRKARARYGQGSLSSSKTASIGNGGHDGRGR